MIDRWVQDITTGEAWRLDSNPGRPVYLSSSGELRWRDGPGTMERYTVHPCCPKAAPQNTDIPETGEQLSIFDFMESDPEHPKETAAGADAAPGEYHEAFRLYLGRGYRPRIADALARQALGMENPDAFLLAKFNITGENLNK